MFNSPAGDINPSQPYIMSHGRTQNQLWRHLGDEIEDEDQPGALIAFVWSGWSTSINRCTRRHSVVEEPPRKRGATRSRSNSSLTYSAAGIGSRVRPSLHSNTDHLAGAGSAVVPTSTPRCCSSSLMSRVASLASVPAGTDPRLEE